jgi:hypothetical protein
VDTGIDPATWNQYAGGVLGIPGWSFLNCN